MSLYVLRKLYEAFRVMDGPFAGRRFQSGLIYHVDQIPAHELGRFVPFAIVRPADLPVAAAARTVQAEPEPDPDDTADTADDTAEIEEDENAA